MAVINSLNQTRFNAFSDMKKYILTIAIAAAALLQGCQPEEVKPVGEPFNRLEQVSGTWQISRVIQVDTDAENKGFPMFAQRLDVTNRVAGRSFTDFRITFNATGDTPTNFTTQAGSSPMNVLPSGTWQFDDPRFPSKIVLRNGNIQQEFDIASLAGLTSGRLTLKLVRAFEGTPFVRYEYEMVKR